jgi:hypothetical protein
MSLGFYVVGPSRPRLRKTESLWEDSCSCPAPEPMNLSATKGKAASEDIQLAMHEHLTCCVICLWGDISDFLCNNLYNAMRSHGNVQSIMQRYPTHAMKHARTFVERFCTSSCVLLTCCFWSDTKASELMSQNIPKGAAVKRSRHERPKKC